MQAIVTNYKTLQLTMEQSSQGQMSQMTVQDVPVGFWL